MTEVKKWSKEAEDDFKEFTLDHLKHFDFLPATFMDSTGKEYDPMDCWNKALELGLVSVEYEEPNHLKDLACEYDS